MIKVCCKFLPYCLQSEAKKSIFLSITSKHQVQKLFACNYTINKHKFPDDLKKTTRLDTTIPFGKQYSSSDPGYKTSRLIRFQQVKPSDNMEKSKYPRVLSIQSHVVSGYCGNKSATFPLQLLGFDVDPINSVQFCNHTGYGVKTGQILTEKDLSDLVDGLAANSLDNAYTHLLTGYIGAPTFLQRVADLVKHLKSVNKDLIYVCDPVMGDNGQMYVPKELLPIYKDVIVPLADIITPNQFEVELLTDRKVSTVEEAIAAIDVLHSKGPKTVVLSSSELGKDKALLGIASTMQDSSRKTITIEIPRLPLNFIGTGDLFAALMLAWTYKTDDLQKSLEMTVASLQAVLKRTMEYVNRNGKSPRNMELQLIKSKLDIENPRVEIKSKLHSS